MGSHSTPKRTGALSDAALSSQENVKLSAPKSEDEPPKLPEEQKDSQEGRSSDNFQLPPEKTMASGLDMAKSVSLADQAWIGTELLKCPCCESTDTKSVYYVHENESQPGHFCNKCQHRWTTYRASRNGSTSGGRRKRRKPERFMANQAQMAMVAVECPSCESTNTKSTNNHNYEESQPHHFCNNCRWHWTIDGSQRDYPLAGGAENKQKNDSLKRKRQAEDSGANVLVEGLQHKAACKETKEVVRTECTESSITLMDEHQQHPVNSDSSIVKGDKGIPVDDELMLNEETTPKDAVMKTLKITESSTLIETSSGGLENHNSLSDPHEDAKDGKIQHSSLDLNATASCQQIWESSPAEIDLPFNKTSFMWEHIESMEAFKSAPQQPHFSPLKQQNEFLREGEAIGLMLTYGNMLESIRSMQLDQPKTKFEENLRTLQILEAHGFAVQLLRTQLTELLKVKDSYSQLDHTFQSVETEVIEEIETIAHLDMNISKLMKERETKSCKVAELQRTLDNLEESIRAARSNFSAVAGATPRNILQ